MVMIVAISASTAGGTLFLGILVCLLIYFGYLRRRRSYGGDKATKKEGNTTSTVGSPSPYKLDTLYTNGSGSERDDCVMTVYDESSPSRLIATPTTQAGSPLPMGPDDANNDVKRLREVISLSNTNNKNNDKNHTNTYYNQNNNTTPSNGCNINAMNILAMSVLKLPISNWSTIYYTEDDYILGFGSYGTVIKAKWTDASGNNYDPFNFGGAMEVAIKVITKSLVNQMGQNYDQICQRAVAEVEVLQEAQSRLKDQSCIIMTYGVVTGELPNELCKHFDLPPRYVCIHKSMYIYVYNCIILYNVLVYNYILCIIHIY